MSVIHAITTLFKADPTPLTDAFKKSENAARQFSQNGRKSLNDFQNAANNMKINDASFKSSLKGMFGKGSNLGFGLSLLTGGGALIALSKALDAMDKMASKLNEIKKRWHDTSYTAYDKFVDLAETLPLLDKVGSAADKVNNLFTGKLDAQNILKQREKIIEAQAKWMEGHDKRVVTLDEQTTKARREADEKVILSGQAQELVRIPEGAGRQAQQLVNSWVNKVRNTNQGSQALQDSLDAKNKEIADAQKARSKLIAERMQAETESNPYLKNAMLQINTIRAQAIDDQIFYLQNEADRINDALRATQRGQTADVNKENAEFRDKARTTWNSWIDSSSKSLQSTVKSWMDKGILHAALQGPKIKEPDKRVAELQGDWFGAAYRPYHRDETDQNAKSQLDATQRVESAIKDGFTTLTGKLTFTMKSL